MFDRLKRGYAMRAAVLSLLVVSAAQAAGPQAREIKTKHTYVRFRSEPGVQPSTKIGYVKTENPLKYISSKRLADGSMWHEVEAQELIGTEKRSVRGWVAGWFFEDSRSEGGASCIDGSCGGGLRSASLDRIPLPPRRPERITAREEPAARPSRSLSCAQRELLAAAKRIAPMRSHSVGLCGPGVQNIIASAERHNPGFNVPPLPESNRYPPEFIPWFKKRGWTNLKIRSAYEAPPGTVVIFRGPNRYRDYQQGMYPPGDWVGHIAIRGDDGLWYTDGRTPLPAGANRYFQAAFVPGPRQIASCGGR